jgi:hypothetical protein
MTDLTARLDAIQDRAERVDIPGTPMAEVLRIRNSQADVPFLLDLARKQQAAIDAVKADGWDEGAEEATEHWAATAYSPNSNGPSDPPRNPYREALEAKP